MKTTFKNNISYGLLFVSSASMLGAPAWAQSKADIQRQFNQETISRPFSVADEATLNSALDAATKRATPTKSPGYPGANIPILGGFGYYGHYARPYYGGYYGGYYNPYYRGWWW